MKKIIAKKAAVSEVTNKEYGIKNGAMTVELQLAQDTDKSSTTTWYNSITFKLTGEFEGEHYRRVVAEGSNRDLIVREFPQLRDVAAMHLTDIDGAPNYPVENGQYFAEHGDVEALAEHLRIPYSDAQDISTAMNYISSKEAFMEAVVKNCRPRWKKEAKLLHDTYAPRFRAEVA